jgi:ribosomal protein S18 acetylase RimI-like enzyme
MIVRELTRDDARAYQELRLYALQESPTAFGSSYSEEMNRPLDMVEDRLGSLAGHTFGAFDQEGKLIGMATLYRDQHINSNHKAFLFGMYVSPEYRGQGVGKSLMEKVIAQARALGLRQINLSVNNANEAPVGLYESFGFERYGLEKDAMRIGEEYYDAAYMVLRLERE